MVTQNYQINLHGWQPQRVKAVHVAVILLLIAMTVLSLVITLATRSKAAHAQSGPPLGAEVGPEYYTFVDQQKEARGFFSVKDGTSDIPRDASGWPMSDAAEVVFDYRPFGAWSPPADDPENVQPDMSGTYHLSFTGQAQIAPYGGDPGTNNSFTVSNQQYNTSTNTTTADITQTAGNDLMFIQFTQTKRNPGDNPGTGITNLHIIRPGYPANSTQVFTNEFVNNLNSSPFTLMRFMGWLDSNSSNPYYGDAKNTIDWSDRTPPDYATQESYNGKHGIAWEYLIQLANLTNKDIWINIPIAATDNYVTQLANLLKSGLNSNIHVYVEYDNEVWNYGFLQYTYNKMAAADEVAKGGSPLNNDGSTDQELWARRRYTKRSIEISNLFKGVYGGSAINNTIRVVNSWWFINPSQFQDQLSWAQGVYGSPNQYLWAIAGANYALATDTSSVDAIFNGWQSSSNSNVTYTQQLRSIANTYGLHLANYEIGLDVGQSTSDLNNKFYANRHDPRGKDIVYNHLKSSYENGVDIASWLAYAGPYSRWGFWGLTEDSHNLNTYKMQGAYEFAGSTPPTGTPTPTSVPTNTPIPTNTPTSTPTPTPTGTPVGGQTTYISDLNWVSATNGVNQVPNKDKSTNGNPLNVSGHIYAKGLGAHAPSTVIYNLNGAYQSFVSDVGVDDECYSGTVDFQVFVDGTQVFDSGVVTGGTVKHVNVSVSGHNQLKLIVTDGGDGISCDHADWAGAAVISGGSGSTPTPTPTATPTQTPTPTPTPTSTPISGGQTTYISDLNWVSATNGINQVPNKDKSANGNPLNVSGHIYSKGLGAHAFSTVVYNLNNAYVTFKSDVGVDDECYSGTVDFQVYVDGNQVFDSGVVTGGTVKTVNVSVSGHNQLKLVVTDGGDGISCDHADWAGAAVTN